MVVTFVSAFIDRTRYDPKLTAYRSLDFYLDHGRRFLEQPVPKVVFLERHIIEQLGSDLSVFPTTTIIPFEKEELLHWPRRDFIHRCTISSWANPQKDTHDYFMVIWNKAEWARRAAELNPYGTTDFVWIDFGIHYICRQDFSAHISHMKSRTVTEGKIRLPGCGLFYMPPPQPGDLVWYFCGGIFAGNREALTEFAEQQAKVLDELLQIEVATWEVTVWFHMVSRCPHLFERYVADHNDSMLTGF